MTRHIGVDESGKGDFFGPLCIAGVLVDEKIEKFFEDSGVKDSKKISDKKILTLEKIIKTNAIHSIVVISNVKYNELYSKINNLNKLLAWGHARVIENICQNNPCDYALSDKFGDDRFIKSALMTHGKNLELRQMFRAESDIAVAAASILARAAYVKKMSEMSTSFGINFPKGCANQIKDVAIEFISKYGKDRLKEVCKTHFKTFREL